MVLKSNSAYPYCFRSGGFQVHHEDGSSLPLGKQLHRLHESKVLLPFPHLHGCVRRTETVRTVTERILLCRKSRHRKVAEHFIWVLGKHFEVPCSCVV